VYPIRRWLVVALAVPAVFVAACGNNGGGASDGGGTNGGTQSASACKAKDALASLQQGKVLSKGPNGEEPVPGDSIKLTEAEIAKVKAMKATAAISLHFGGNDWSNAQVAGAKSEFAKLGIQLARVTDAQGKPEKQVSDIETIMTNKPDILLSIPIDPVATASAYKDAAAKGVKIVFMDVPADGMKPGTANGYVSDVSADNYGNGVASAHIMASELGCKGNVGIVKFAQNFYVTNLRADGFEKTIETDYPDMKIVATQQIAAPDWAGNAEKAASAMLTQHQDLKGIFAFFDIPAEGVANAARSAGRNDLVVTTSDLGLNVGIAIAKGKIVKGTGSQRPYEQGVTEAKLAAYALLGKKAPPYVALAPLAVTKDNVAQAWTEVYQSPPPAKLQEATK
jgi:ribose transport system substrate-binding protein